MVGALVSKSLGSNPDPPTFRNSKNVIDLTSILTSTGILTSSHWFPQVGCGVPVGLNGGSVKPSLAYIAPRVV